VERSASGPLRMTITVRTSMGEPKRDGRNGTHELNPFERPAHTVTTKVGEWLVLIDTEAVCVECGNDLAADGYPLCLDCLETTEHDH